jgi:ketosteroid isomerase-like protein
MSEQQNVEVAQQAYAAFGRGDLEGILALLDPQVAWRTPGPPDLPSAGLRHGVNAVREL